MKEIADFINRVRNHIEDEEYLINMKSEVQALTARFPLYSEL